MIVTNTDSIPGREITEIIGVVRGNSVRAKNCRRELMAAYKGKGDGEVAGLTALLSEAREAAYQRMIDDARGQGADAVLNVRFTTSMVVEMISEMLAYGTAVRLDSR